MRVVTSKARLAAHLESERRRGSAVGFVPTMGFFHEGHLSLMRRARRECDRVVVSIFVNPLQFGPAEDLSRYPSDPDRDLALAREVGVDEIFAPAVEEMYPEGAIATRVEVGPIGEVGEGRFRPGHLAGVATVCVKLFSIVGACRAYFGRKDAQQLAAVRQVVRDLDVPVEVVDCPTVREPDGLAASSRNVYLDLASREAAAVLPRALTAAQERAAGGERSAEALRRLVEQIVAAEPRARLQYVEVFDPVRFQPIVELEEAATVALAAFVGETRLVDNMEARVEAHPQRRYS